MLIRPLGRSSGAADLPEAAANTFLRRNSGNSAYEAKTSLQVADELIGVRDWRGRNVLINGDFRVWPEGTSFTITTTRYTAEGWLYYTGGGSPSATISQQSFVVGQVDVPGEPEFFLRIAQTAAATTIEPSFVQRIEGVRTLAGQTVTRSVWLRVQSGTLSLVPQIKQHFSTGGTPSSDVSMSQSAITVTTAWQRFVIAFDVPSIAGKTLGSDRNDHLELVLRPPIGQTFTLDIADYQLESGSVATPFERRPIQQELALCQRYFQKTYNLEQPPGSVTNRGLFRRSYTTVAINHDISWDFPVKMRAVPTVTVYSPVSGNSGVLHLSGMGDAAASIAFIGETYTSANLSTAVATSTANFEIRAEFTANARL